MKKKEALKLLEQGRINELLKELIDEVWM